MTVTKVALGSDGKRIFKAFAPLYVEQELRQLAKATLDILIENLPTGELPHLYIIEFNRDDQASSIWSYLHRPRKAPILIILDSDRIKHFHSILNMYTPRNVTGYLLRSSLPALLQEAVETICRNSYFCDPNITQIKIPKGS